MNELTDLQICQRIAEIEGVKLMPYRQGDRTAFSAGSQTIYNPLTDDALCFQLMIKYKISLIQHQNNTAVYCIWNHDQKHATNTMTNPNRAICLAIIKSKE
jgi:hypothetical protein